MSQNRFVVAQGGCHRPVPVRSNPFAGHGAPQKGKTDMACNHWDNGFEGGCVDCQRSVAIITVRVGAAYGAPRDEADDVVQRVRLKLWQHPAVAARGNVYAWIVRIVRQQWAETLRDPNRGLPRIRLGNGDNDEDAGPADHRAAVDVDDVEIRLLEDAMFARCDAWAREAWRLRIHQKVTSTAAIGRAVGKSAYLVGEALSDMERIARRCLGGRPRKP